MIKLQINFEIFGPLYFGWKTLNAFAFVVFHEKKIHIEKFDVISEYMDITAEKYVIFFFQKFGRLLPVI